MTSLPKKTVHRGSLLCASIFLLAPALPMHGQLLTQTFQAPLGGLPPDWSVVQAAGTNKNISAWTNGDDVSPTNGLRFSRQDSGGIGANAYYTPTGGQNFSNFSGSVLMQLGGGNSTHVTGVIMRGANATGGTAISGYFAGLHRAFVSGVGWRYSLFIDENPATYQSRGTQLDATALTLAGTESNTFRLEFGAQGSNLTATAFQWSGTAWSNLGSAAATDNTYTTGVLGLRAGFGNTDGNALFGNLAVIPEPSSVALIAAGMAWLAIRRARRRKD